jgi:hypothetical protein
MEKVLGGDQFEDGIAEILEALVVRRAAFRVLVVVRAMRQRLPQQRDVVKANTERALKLL